MTGAHRVCVVVPFFNHLARTERCLASLRPATDAGAQILLVDDGSEPAASGFDGLLDHLKHPSIHMIRHARNRGVAAARNSAIHWCRREGIDFVIMIDSDCVAAPQLVERHLGLLERFPDATAIAGSLVNAGGGMLARFDGMLSFPNSKPFGEVCDGTDTLYHLPMANIAIRLDRLPEREFVFDERLNTGEDALLVRELRRRGDTFMFSPEPAVSHYNRETFADVLAHHRAWGYHQYFVQFGGDFRRPLFNPLYRVGFVCLFAPCLPAYAIVGAALSVLPWLRHRPAFVFAFLPAVVIWFAKGSAVLSSAINPRAALRETRAAVQYTEVATPVSRSCP